MKLEEKIEYCKICSNKGFELQTGTYCKLTNQKPEFDISCPDFNEDPVQREEMEVRYLSKVRNEQLENYSYPTSRKKILDALNILPKTVEVKRSKGLSIFLILIFGSL
ncbi:hypothetical protein R9C00_03080 [Flammeovirgaceae bacterium SG7u.111]|nr:hypothetical protein [Flammeovirgaceae bacterium SG7u.132]WPO36425.1 hypothetical protein R9C00_03080 [Flammeovirgaceae bacterium SG7u.111]